MSNRNDSSFVEIMNFSREGPEYPSHQFRLVYGSVLILFLGYKVAYFEKVFFYFDNNIHHCTGLNEKKSYSIIYSIFELYLTVLMMMLMGEKLQIAQIIFLVTPKYSQAARRLQSQ